MRLLLLALLLFEPIIIDEQTFNAIMQSAHANMRGTEFDMLRQVFKELEQQAVANKQKDTTSK